MNIDIINFSNEDAVSHMTTLMFYRFLPYVTLPSRITNFSMTCIDHIFIRLSHKDKAVNMINCLFTVTLVNTCHVSFLLRTIGNAMLGRSLWLDYLVRRTLQFLYKKWKSKIGMTFIQIRRITIKNLSLQWYVYSSSHSLLSGCLGNACMISQGWQQR